jgi:hypothetical protein
VQVGHARRAVEPAQVRQQSAALGTTLDRLKAVIGPDRARLRLTAE